MFLEASKKVVDWSFLSSENDSNEKPEELDASGAVIAPSSGPSFSFPRVYLGVKIGIR